MGDEEFPVDDGIEVVDEPSSEEIAAQKAAAAKELEIEEFGIWAECTCEVNEAERTVKVIIDDPLPDKDRIEITTDEAKACQLIGGAVGGFLKDMAGQVRFFDGK